MTTRSLRYVCVNQILTTTLLIVSVSSVSVFEVLIDQQVGEIPLSGIILAGGVGVLSTVTGIVVNEYNAGELTYSRHFLTHYCVDPSDLSLTNPKVASQIQFPFVVSILLVIHPYGNVAPGVVVFQHSLYRTVPVPTQSPPRGHLFVQVPPSTINPLTFA